MSYTLNAIKRSEEQQGKGASRRLRKENLVPAIVYGGKEEALSICVKTNELVKALQDEAFFSTITTLALDGENEEVIIKALQRHPSKGFPLHVDFQRIVRGQVMSFTIPLHFVGEAVGTKQGGVLSTNITEIEISCLPRQLVDAIEVDVSKLEIGDLLRLSDIQLPEGFSIDELANEDSTDRVVVSVQAPTVEKEPEEDEETEEAEGAEEATDADSEEQDEDKKDDE